MGVGLARPVGVCVGLKIATGRGWRGAVPGVCLALQLPPGQVERAALAGCGDVFARFTGGGRGWL